MPDLLGNLAFRDLLFDFNIAIELFNKSSFEKARLRY